jgi:uncharacterized protein (DUF362 family)
MKRKPRVYRLDAGLDAAAADLAALLAESVPRELNDCWHRLRQAKRVFIKANLVGYMDSARKQRDLWHKNHPIGSTAPTLAEAVLQLVRRFNLDAEILLGDGLDISDPDTVGGVMDRSGFAAFAPRYGAELIDCNTGPYRRIPVPGGGSIYRWLYLNERIADADFVINLPKLKVHTTAGVSLGIKNLFGSIPRRFYGGFDRSLMHSNLFKLSRILVDVAKVQKPDLTVVDAIVASNKYFIGDPVEMNALVVGDNVVAVDAACMALMGFDPRANFPLSPFTDMENHLVLAEAESLGPTLLDDIGLDPDFLDIQYPFALEHLFYVMGPQEIIDWHRIVAAGARHYLHGLPDLMQQYPGKWIYIQEGELLWSADTIKGCSMRVRNDHREDRYGFCIQVLPPEQQPERIEAYLPILNGTHEAFGKGTGT